MKRILVIDDHRMIGSSMALLFKHSKPEVEVDIAVSMDKAYPFLEQNGTYDLVLLDYDLPRIDGLAGLKSIKEKYPEQKVCMLSGISAPNIVYACIHHGAVGWISKTMHEKQLIHAVLMMAAGGEFIPADVPPNIGKNGISLQTKKQKLLSFFVKVTQTKILQTSLVYLQEQYKIMFVRCLKKQTSITEQSL